MRPLRIALRRLSRKDQDVQGIHSRVLHGSGVPAHPMRRKRDPRATRFRQFPAGHRRRMDQVHMRFSRGVHITITNLVPVAFFYLNLSSSLIFFSILVYNLAGVTIYISLPYRFISSRL